MMKQGDKLVVVVSWDNCGATVYGPFDTRDDADVKVDNLMDGFDDWDRQHVNDITVTTLTHPS
tara:strand:- start:293 stop:481 length:189 start_codon:yes stop_codon:yes gene_type:complete